MNSLGAEKILTGGVYQPHISLKEHIERLSDSKCRVDEKEIANLVVKYFFNYLFPGSHDVLISEDEANRVFQIVHHFFGLIRSGESEIRTDDFFLFQDINNLSYQLAMLGDVASTLVLFKDIITRKVDDIVGGGQYFGIDLGTGSGILLLAQYIQAQRNGFTSLSNVGVELNFHAQERTKKVAKKLGFGEVIYGDSSAEETYTPAQHFPALSFLSSENLTPTYICLYKDDEIKEPFFENFAVLSQVFGKDIVDACQKFPEKVSFVLGEKRFIVGPEFVDFSQEVVRQRQKVNHFPIAPEGILVSGRFYRTLGEIGDNYRCLRPSDRGITPYLRDWKHRWKMYNEHSL